MLLTHALLGHWLADVHAGSFGPAFTLSVSRRTTNRKSAKLMLPTSADGQMPIVSVDMGKLKKKKLPN
jgi:hypothetical protein